MKVEEKKVKELVLKFQENSEINVLKQIIMEISDMVYNYPLVVFHINLEKCSDFYIYFIERIKSLLSKYEPARSSFNTWFNIILKSQCLNWLNFQQRKMKKSVITESMDNGLYYRIPYNLNDSTDTKKDNISSTVNNYIADLPSLDYLIINLLYYDIDNKLLDKLSSYNKITAEENISLIKQFLNNNKKFKIQSELTSKISVLQYKILELKKKLSSSSDDEKDRLKTRLNSYLSNLKFLKKKSSHNLQNLDIRAIAVILNEKQMRIYNRLTKIKKDLYIKLKEKII